jgi:hypothetical protein
VEKVEVFFAAQIEVLAGQKCATIILLAIIMVKYFAIPKR